MSDILHIRSDSLTIDSVSRSAVDAPWAPSPVADLLDKGPIDAPALHELVYRRLRDAIQAGQIGIEGDDRIGLRELARLLQVSTTPIREAVRRLEAEGLVVVERGAGIRVRRLSAQDFAELAEMRVRLETLVLERSIARIRDADMRLATDTLERLDLSQDPDEWRELNHRFHMLLYEAADYPRVISAVRTIWVAVDPYLRIYTQNPTNLAAARNEHHRLLEAVGRGDKKEAVRILTAHIERSKRALLKDGAGTAFAFAAPNHEGSWKHGR
jgi:DNA-binding GntR family transcriptional regulator